MRKIQNFAKLAEPSATLAILTNQSVQADIFATSSPVLREDVVYGLDEGILAAMDAATGKRPWKGGRYGYGPLSLAGAHLVVPTESGEAVLVEANPSAHREIARFEALSGKTWNVPALAQGRLYVRNTTDMACYRIAP